MPVRLFQVRLRKLEAALALVPKTSRRESWQACEPTLPPFPRTCGRAGAPA